MTNDYQRTIVRWQTCDDDCPETMRFRIVVRNYAPEIGDWPVIVRQRYEDSTWIDDGEIGHPGLDGDYTIISDRDDEDSHEP